MEDARGLRRLRVDTTVYQPEAAGHFFVLADRCLECALDRSGTRRPWRSPWLVLFEGLWGGFCFAQLLYLICRGS